MKIMTIVGTRPEIIKMSRVEELEKFTNHVLRFILDKIMIMN